MDDARHHRSWPGVGDRNVQLTALAADEPRKPQVPELKVEKYTLANGLTVILHEDHKTPVAAVNVWYKVGSKDEQPGRTGFAHLFEHMMFLGSKHHDEDLFIRSRSSAPRTTRTTDTIGRTITRPCPATRWSWRSGSRPIGWDSCCLR